MIAGVPDRLHVTWQAREDITPRDLRFTLRATGPDAAVLWEAPTDPTTSPPAVWPAGQVYRLTFPVTATLNEVGTTDATLELCAHVAG